MRTAVGVFLVVVQTVVIEAPRRALGALARAVWRAFGRLGGTGARTGRALGTQAGGLLSRARVHLVARPARTAQQTTSAASHTLGRAFAGGLDLAGGGAGRLRQGTAPLAARLRPDVLGLLFELRDPLTSRRELAKRAIAWVGFAALLVGVGIAVGALGQ